jgi:hypothetical protein
MYTEVETTQVMMLCLNIFWSILAIIKEFNTDKWKYQRFLYMIIYSFICTAPQPFWVCVEANYGAIQYKNIITYHNNFIKTKETTKCRTNN